MPLLLQGLEGEDEPRVDPGRRVVRKAQVDRDPIRRLEPDAVDLTGHPVRLVQEDRLGLAAVLRHELHALARRHAVGLEEDVQLPLRALLVPGLLDRGRPLAADPGDLAKPGRLLAEDSEGPGPKGVDDLVRVDLAYAGDKAAPQVFANSIHARRQLAAKGRDLELGPVLGVPGPLAAQVEGLAALDARKHADDGDKRRGLSPVLRQLRPHLRNRVVVLLVEEDDALDDPVEGRGRRGWLGRGIHGMRRCVGKAGYHTGRGVFANTLGKVPSEFRQSGIDGVGACGAKLRGVVRSRGDAPGLHSGVVPGLDVKGGVADHEARPGLAADQLQHVRHEPRIRLEPGRVLRPDDRPQVRGEAQGVADRARGGADLVGADGENGSPGMKRLEEIEGSRQRLQILEHDLPPIGVVNPKAVDLVLGWNDLGEGILEAAADGGPNLLEGRPRQPKLLHCIAITAMDRREMVDEGAIEVKKESAEDHKGSGCQIGAPATSESGIAKCRICGHLD